MDLREAISILESSLNIECSLKEGIREVEARLIVAEVAKKELEREKGCDFCNNEQGDNYCRKCGKELIE